MTDAGPARPDVGPARPDPGPARPDPGPARPDPGPARPDPGPARPDGARIAHGLSRALRRPWQLHQANRWAIDAFAARYAAAHGLAYSEEGETPGGSLLLAAAESARSHSFMRGALGGGPEGLLLYAERLADTRKNIHTGWTVARYALPEARELTAGLACVPRLTPAWGGRVVLASALPDQLTATRTGDRAFDDRHEIGIEHEDDQAAVRALFDEAFSSWLSDLPFGRHGEAALRFELCRDVLSVWLREKQRTTATLDGFCAHARHVCEHVKAVASATVPATPNRPPGHPPGRSSDRPPDRSSGP